MQFAAGNQAVRWLVGPIGGAGEGSLTVEVRYLYGNEREIARMQSSGNVTAGIGGGEFDSAVARAAEEIATYTTQHFH